MPVQILSKLANVYPMVRFCVVLKIHAWPCGSVLNTLCIDAYPGPAANLLRVSGEGKFSGFHRHRRHPLQLSAWNRLPWKIDRHDCHAYCVRFSGRRALCGTTRSALTAGRNRPSTWNWAFACTVPPYSDTNTHAPRNKYHQLAPHFQQMPCSVPSRLLTFPFLSPVPFLVHFRLALLFLPLHSTIPFFLCMFPSRVSSAQLISYWLDPH